MFKVFDTPEFLTEQDIVKMYPHSRYILKDIKDINNVSGYLMAVSTDKSSFIQICEKREELSESGLDVALLGSYGGMKLGVLSKVN